MRISSEKKKKKTTPLLLPAILLGAILLLLSADLILNKEKEEKTAITAAIYCDAEQVKDGRFVNGAFSFGGGNYQSSAEARSGQYACRLTKENRYGMQYQTANPPANSRYRVSIWRYATAGHQGFISAELHTDGKLISQIQEGVAVEEKDGWERLELWIQLPDNQLIDTLKIYAYVEERSGATFFDDLEIESFLSDKIQTNSRFIPDQLNIKLDEKTYQKLNRQRWQAFKDGIIIIDESEQWSKGKMYSKKEAKEIPIELRLKGDWLDHLKGEKWSFRIKTRKQAAWNQMLTFSVQHPETRSYLKEWFYHEWLQKEKILAPRYDFLNLEVNGKSRGIFAVEEHFEKQLPELQERREGIILKLSEDLLWLGLQEEYTFLSKGQGLPEKEERAFEQSEVQAFKEKKISQSPNLSKQFEEAQSLLHQFKYQQGKVEELFDVEKLAKYYAITDLMQAYHGLTWHNMRFYFNPIINKLEPIGFDGFGTVATAFGGGPFIAYHLEKERHPSRFFTYLFEEDAFFEQYIQYLDQFSQEDYLKKLILDLDKAKKERERFLQQEFPDYRFRTDAIIDRARIIRRLILAKNEYSLLARNTNDGQIKLANQHNLPLKIIAYGNTESPPQTYLKQPLFLYSTPLSAPVDWHTLELKNKPQYIFFQVAGLEEIYHTKVGSWSVPKSSTASQLKFQFAEPQSNKLYELVEDRVLFKKGNHIIREDILIPKGYRVYIEAGTKLDFQNSAAFISKSPIYLMGTADNGIKIYSSDGSGNGFTVLQASEQSQVQYVLFEGWNTLQKGNWQLTGAVNFYESEVAISHSSFLNNHCEDALNVVRSKFTLTHSKIANTYADGLDADFCEGTLDQVRFEDTGNDAIDFSGSNIVIEDCLILRAGDKGISVGEAAKVLVKNAWIDGAVNGVASKDLSTLTIENIMLKNCINGFTAYQKKPEFGAARIEVIRYKQEQTKHLHQIEEGSVLILEGKVISEI